MRPSAPGWPRPGDLVLIQDADLEYDPDDWPRLLDPILKGKARVVYGSRFTGERKNMLPLHWIGNRLLSLVTNVLYSSTLSDMETCYKLFERRCSRASPSCRTASTSSPRSRPRCSGAATGFTRCRSPMPGVRSTRARRSPGATASVRSRALIRFRFTREY